MLSITEDFWQEYTFDDHFDWNKASHNVNNFGIHFQTHISLNKLHRKAMITNSEHYKTTDNYTNKRIEEISSC